MGRVVFIAAALALSGLAMAWSALPPGADPSRAPAAPMAEVAHRIAEWRRSGPADGGQDWPAAARTVFDGDAKAGADLVARHGCGACHVIPGIAGANGTVGPSLAGVADRAYLAGELPNEPGQLTRWLLDPPARSPDTAMPDLGLSETEARDVAAFLYEQGSG